MGSYTLDVGNETYSLNSFRFASRIGSLAQSLFEKLKTLNKLKGQKSIETTLAEADVKDISTLILYEPKVHSAGFLDRVLGFPEYHFIVIARTPQKVKLAIDKIYELGYGGGGDAVEGSSDNYFFTGTSGLYGERHHVIRDFTKLVRNNPRQEEILFIPIEGLVTTVTTEFSGKYLKIYAETIKRCVESARLG